MTILTTSDAARTASEARTIAIIEGAQKQVARSLKRANEIVFVDETIPAFEGIKAINTRYKFAGLESGKHVCKVVAPIAIQEPEPVAEMTPEELADDALLMLRKNRAGFAALSVSVRRDVVRAMVQFGQWARLSVGQKVAAVAGGVIVWIADPSNFCRFSCPSISRPETGLHHHVELDPDTGELTCDCEYGRKASAEGFCVHIQCFQLDCMPAITARLGVMRAEALKATSPDVAGAICYGKQISEDRKARALTLKQEAERIGVCPIELNAVEFGRADKSTTARVRGAVCANTPGLLTPERDF